MKKINKLLVVAGLTFLFANSLYLFYLFSRTYIAPGHIILHTINEYGEAGIEMAFFTVQLCLMIPAFIILLMRSIKDATA